jgi:hypothetical protein
MSAPDLTGAGEVPSHEPSLQEPSPRESLRFGTIVIVGGGCYGGYYHRQLQRAARANALVADRVLIVDHDAKCAVARTLAAGTDTAPLDCELEIADWRAFFATYLDRAAHTPDQYARDAIVPSPLMPHLMGEWLVARARARAGGDVATHPFDRPPVVPWERAGDDGTHYVSFATWMCPINCIEPRICPHTKGERTWSMPARLADYARERNEAGEATEIAVLHCEHRAYGVGMFDTRAVIDADARIRAASERGVADVVIGTVSHCHGALTRLVIGAHAARGNSPDR